VEGVEVLARVLEGEDPDFVLLMSSLSAVLGGLGYGAYAAANAFMDAFVEAQHARGRRSWISVGWDSWQDPAPDAQRRQSEASRLSMTPAEGAAVLDRILGLGPVRRVVVSTADLPSRIARWTRPAAAAETPAEAPAASRHPRPNLQRGYVAPETPTEKRLSEIWGRLLGIDRVGLHDNFFELGGTSLVAVQMVSQVREAFDTELSVAAVFEGPTVHSFCRLILEGAATGGALVTASSPAQE
jgi:acyl carrier protein